MILGGGGNRGKTNFGGPSLGKKIEKGFLQKNALEKSSNTEHVEVQKLM